MAGAVPEFFTGGRGADHQGIHNLCLISKHVIKIML
jgi:hypothetical protein